MRPRLLFALLAAGLLLGGCSEVKPWEKGYIARPEMAFDPDPLEAGFKRHIYDSKEAASGGYGVGGGGCGCN
ncbi:DUF4266 domain-containing protein [Endothiovibrio diazotrophicus]